MAPSPKKVAGKIRLQMHLGKSLSQATEALKAKGVSDDVLQQAVLLVDTPDVGKGWRGILDMVFSRAILAVMGILTVFLVLAWYARQGRGEEGVIVVLTHVVLYLVVAALLKTCVNFMVQGAKVRLVWALYAVFFSEIACAVIAMVLNPWFGAAIVLAISVFIRYVTYMAFITGPSPGHYIVLALFFLVITLIAEHLIGSFADEVFYASSAASLAMMLPRRGPWMSAER